MFIDVFLEKAYFKYSRLCNNLAPGIGYTPLGCGLGVRVGLGVHKHLWGLRPPKGALCIVQFLKKVPQTQ